MTTKQSSPVEGQIVPMSPAVMRDAMLNEASLSVTDPAKLQEEIQARILAAASDDDILNAGSAGLDSAEKYVDVPLSIEGFRFNKTGYDEGSLPVYAVINAANLDTGEDVVFSCGGETVCTQLFKLDMVQSFEDRNGFACAIASKTTGKGNTVYSLRPLTASERKRTAV